MERTADLIVVQKTIIDTFHKDHRTSLLKRLAVPKHVNEKLTGSVVGKGALRRSSTKVDSRLGRASLGMMLMSVHQEPPSKDVFRKEVSTVGFLISSDS